VINGQILYEKCLYRGMGDRRREKAVGKKGEKDEERMLTG
jgi:hypothetical protein